jgi:endonuclease/exonuclease/phosphatase family metal-dependent hydrolase
MARVCGALIAAAAALGLLGADPSAVASDPTPRPPPHTLRFVTFNLLHGGIFSELSGDDDGLEDRLRLAVEGLRALDADVVGLQEASTGRRRGDVTARLARTLGYRYVRAPAAIRPLGSEHLRRAVASILGFTEGPGLMSRFPIARWTAHDLPACGRPLDVRTVLLAELETPAGPLAAVSAHTSGDACHARAVAELVRAHAGSMPAVVMGDFNAPESSPAIRFLTQETGWLDAFRHTNPTAAGFTDGQDVQAPWATAHQRIDYVFLAPGARLAGRVVGSRIVLGEPRHAPAARVRWPSDHYGVLADVALEDPAASSLAADGSDRDVGRPPGGS